MRLHAALWLLMTYYAGHLRVSRLPDTLAQAPALNAFTPQPTSAVLEAAARLRARTGVPCLPAAIAVRHVLRGMGTQARLVLGVHPHQFEDGHAWLEIDGETVMKDDERWSIVWREDV